MRLLSELELDLVAGGNPSSDAYPGSSGGGYGGGGGGSSGGMWFWNPVWTGVEWPEYGGSSGPNGYWSFVPHGSSGSGGGQASGGGNGQDSSDHPEDCSTPSGAAVQIANHVTGAPASGASGPPSDPLRTSTGNDWTSVEFGAVIVRNADGSFGAYNDKILSDNRADGVAMAFSTSADVVGLWHSHASGSGGTEANYPSRNSEGAGHTDDWAQLQLLKDNYTGSDPNYDPSTWILGPDGITREFKLSQRSFFEGLTAQQMRDGVGLGGTERTQSCGG